jgi:hypothetical protein
MEAGMLELLTQDARQTGLTEEYSSGGLSTLGAGRAASDKNDQPFPGWDQYDMLAAAVIATDDFRIGA